MEETDLRRQGIEICGSDGDGGEAAKGEITTPWQLSVSAQILIYISISN